jgi:hypothetical protein
VNGGKPKDLCFEAFVAPALTTERSSIRGALGEIR